MKQLPRIKEGDIIYFYYIDAQKHKYAVNVEVLNVGKNSFTGVLMTTKRIDCIYQGDYLLPDGIMPNPTKVICDQPVKVYKGDVVKICGNVGAEILKEIRKKVAETLGII